MSAEQSLRDGDLKAALAKLQEQVRKDPGDAKHRIFLFQLLAIHGQWGRALTQLNVAGELDAGALAMVQTYREALGAEAFRAEVFAGRRAPLIFGRPEPWIAQMVQALQWSAEGQHEQAGDLRAEAFETAPATTGRIGEEAFAWIADGDQRLGPILEAIMNGRYYWVPFHRIGAIALETPEDLRDLVWMPAHLTWANGGETVALIPTRYPGSEASEHARLQMSRATEWSETGWGIGQRMLATDAGEYALMDVRRIELDSTEEGGDAQEPAVADGFRG